LNGLLTSYAEKVTSSVWATTTYAYTDTDAPCQPSEIIDPLNQETTIDYNSAGKAVSINKDTSVGEALMYFEFTQDMVLDKIIDFQGNEYKYTFNGNGFLSNAKQYDGSVSTGTLISDKDITRNPNNQVTITEDNVSGLTTTAEYAANGNQTCATSELGCNTCAVATGTSGGSSYINPSEPVFTIPERPLPVEVNPLNPSSAGTLPGSLISPAVSFYSPSPATTTDSQSHTTTYAYDDSMKLVTSADYLDRDTEYTYDDYGRLSTVTLPNGKTTTYAYTDNSQLYTVATEGEGTQTFTYDNAGRVTFLTDPVQGTFAYTYNVRGNKISELIENNETEYTYDLLGRLTAVSYPDSSSDTFSYSPEGYLTSKNGDTFEYDEKGNLTEWARGSDKVDYAYLYPGSEVLGLPNNAEGSGNIGDYSFTYTYQHWLYTLTDTSKTSQTYAYVYSSSKELTQLNYPNTLQLHQTWSSKMLDLLTVTDASQQTTYLSSDATFNGNEQMTDYDFSVNAGQSSFSEAYDLTYDSLGRLSTMETDSTSRTVTHGYDAGNGQLTSLQFSDLGTYSIDYLLNGNIESITYPNNQGEETYTYAGGKGRLSKIEYPNDDTLEFLWNDKDEVTRITFTEYTTQEETRYTMTYTPNHQVASLTQSIDSIQQYVWTFSWAPNGLEKAVKTVNGIPVITQDFTTDPQGRILSMTYDTTGEGYDGELYFHYDHFGNTTLLTDTNGNPVASFEYDLHSGKIVNEWNPSGIEMMNLIEGIKAAITIKLQNIIFIEIMKKAIEKIINQYSAITITDKVEFKLTGHTSGYIYSGVGNTSYCDCSPNLDNCNDWNNRTQASFKDEFKNYHDSLINDINALSSKSEICNMLNTEWMDHKENYDYYLWWFGSDYPQDYTKVHPFDDTKWHEEFHYQWEYEIRLYHDVRYDAGALQIIDCLRKKYDCGAVAVMPDPE